MIPPVAIRWHRDTFVSTFEWNRRRRLGSFVHVDRNMDGNIRNRKVFSVKKMEHSKEYKKLKLQEEFLEKNLASTIKGLKIDTDLIQQIAAEKLQASGLRELETQKISASVLSLIKELKWLNSTLREAGPCAIKTLDIRECGSRLTRLSTEIEDLKRKRSQLDALAREEDVLDSDLRESEKLIFTENLQPLSKSTIRRKCPTRSEVNDEFTELVARTGHAQGWTDEDHSLFLKMRQKFHSVPQLVNELRKKRPHLSNEEIVNHEAWHKLYTKLRDKRKSEIAEWRKRNRNRNKNYDSTVSCGEKKTLTKRKQETDRSIETKNNKKMIENWKAEKARKSAMDEEQRIRLERVKIEEEKRLREIKRREARIKLKNYREERAKSSVNDSRSISHTNLKEEMLRSQDSLKLIKSFREQDERFVRKRLSRLKVSKKIDDEEPAKKEGSKFRGYSTLFKATKVWEEKCKRDINTGDSQFGKVNYVKDIQRLSAPGWRAEPLRERL